MFRGRRVLIKLMLLLSILQEGRCQESAQYLQSAVQDLRRLSTRQSYRHSSTLFHSSSPPTTRAHFERRAQHSDGNDEDDAPPLSLTKGELAALYDSAITKGQTVNLDLGDGDTYVQAAVHQIDGESDESHHRPTYSSGPHPGSDVSEQDTTGYYYYYYPVKSFLNEMAQTGASGSSGPSSSGGYGYHKPHVYKEIEGHSTYRPPYQYHSHHHQHNVTITGVDKNKNKAMEPLFMAISGFIGMAVMLFLSVIVFPKFALSGKPPNKIKKDDMGDFARLALEAIEGNCAERFACELSKTARNFNLQENRFVKLLKRIAPSTFGKHMNKVKKYANKQLTCTAIPCKKKNNNNNNKNKNNNKNNSNNQKKKKKPPPKKKH